MLQVSFSSQSSGNSTYTSTMTVTAPAASAGEGSGEQGYTEVTISAVTPDLVCSQVIEVEG